MLNSFGHEVYVLDQHDIHHDISRDYIDHSVNVWQSLNDSHNVLLFLLWSILILGLIGVIYHLSRQPFFKKIGKKIDKTTLFAPDIIRIAFGASILFSVSHGALYGPEIPLSDLGGGYVIQTILWISGTALILGIGNRLWAVVSGLIWLWALMLKGPYMLTYINYLGEAIAIYLLPYQRISIDFLLAKKRSKVMSLERYSMPVARILFGISLLYTAISIKFMNTALTLDVANQYALNRFFPFDPSFIVLGAALIEVLIAILFMVGFLQRFTSIVFLVFMMLSIVFFKESVWPHYLLIALGIGLFLHKPDIWSVDFYRERKKLKT